MWQTLWQSTWPVRVQHRLYRTLGTVAAAFACLLLLSMWCGSADAKPVLCAAPAQQANAAPAAPDANIPTAARAYRATLLRAAHAQWGLDAPVATLAAQVHAESGWQPGAVSKVGAVGLAQFMPATAQWWCSKAGESAAACQPTNPTWALRAMVGYDYWLYQRLPMVESAPPCGEDARLWATLRAYNGGLGHWLAEYQRARIASAPAPPSVQAIDAACGSASRAPQFCAENLAYPHRILLALRPRYLAWSAQRFSAES